MGRRGGYGRNGRDFSFADSAIGAAVAPKIQQKSHQNGVIPGGFLVISGYARTRRFEGASLGAGALSRSVNRETGSGCTYRRGPLAEGGECY